MANPFSNGTFKPRERDKSPGVRLAFPDDSFGIKVTKVGNEFPQDTDAGVVKKVVYNGELLEGSNLSPYTPKGKRDAVQPPEVGTVVAYFHDLTYADECQHWHDQNLQAAIKEAGVTSIVEGDELWVIRLEDSGKSHVYDYVLTAVGERKETKSPFNRKKA